MKPLRMYWLMKGEQNLKIGDNIKDAFEYPSDFNGTFNFDILDWNFDFEKMLPKIQNEFKIKNEILKDNGNMCESNIYICSNNGTIRGIIPINHKK